METYQIPQGEGFGIFAGHTTPIHDKQSQELKWSAEYRVDHDGSVIVDSVNLDYSSIPKGLLVEFLWFETLINKVKDFEHLENHIENIIHKEKADSIGEYQADMERIK